MSAGLDGQGNGDLFDVLPCGVAVTDAGGTILRVNLTLCTWLGLDASELVGRKKLQELFTMGGRIFHQTHWLPSLQMQGSLAEVKFDVRRKDSRILPMMLNVVRKKQGKTSVDIVSLTVAEERNKYERELLAARKRADDLLELERASQLALEDRALFAEQMIGIVSHDLRNPLAAILVGSKLLTERGGPLSPEKDKLARTVANSARRAQRLVEDLLDFTVARIGRRLTVNRQQVDFHELIERTVTELTMAFPGRRLVHVRQGQDVSSLDGDRIAQLLGNLVGNAMAYGDILAPVTITSDVSPSRVSLAVHNAGAPIDEAVQQHMFEPMVRGSHENSSVRSIGLGLYIVRAIATAHDGRVEVFSTTEDGTTFTFSCPPT